MAGYITEASSTASPSFGLSLSDDESREPLIHSDSPGAEKSPGHHLPGKQTNRYVTLCILLTELCERLTFYGLTANLLIFCKDQLNFTPPYPTTVNLIFQGTDQSRFSPFSL